MVGGRADGRVAHGGLAGGAVSGGLIGQVQRRVEGRTAVGGARTRVEKAAFPVDQTGALLGVPGAQQPVDRDVDEVGVAVPALTVGEGELGDLGDTVHEVDTDALAYVGSEAEDLGHAELLEHRGALAPRAGLVHGVAAVGHGGRVLVGRAPVGHVRRGQQGPLGFSAAVDDGLGEEGADGLGHEPLGPGAAGRVDLRLAVAAGGLGLGDDPPVGGGEKGVVQAGSGGGEDTVRQVDGG